MDGECRLTKSCRNSIIALLVHGIEEDGWVGTVRTKYEIWGCLTPKEFLERLYPLRDMPAKNSKYRNAEEEVSAFSPTSGCYPVDWVFRDGRFRLGDGPDDVLLNFLCAVFHPTVRNDCHKGEWTRVLDRLNGTLKNARYAILPKGWIGLQAVYGWRDLTKARFASLTELDLKEFGRLFLGHGDVVGFYKREEFDDFTNQVVGVPLCSYYESSKGASLRQYLHECMDESKVLKLVGALMKHGEDHGLWKDDPELYAQCQEIWRKAVECNPAVSKMAEAIKTQFDNAYIQTEINAMMALQKDNPTDAIGKAKELIESCCKTILDRKGIEWDSKWDLSKLAKETRKTLHLLPEDISKGAPAAEAITQLLSHLGAIAGNMGEIRNAYGSGHGKSEKYRGLQERHAKLAIGCSSTLVCFLWDSFLREEQAASDARQPEEGGASV